MYESLSVIFTPTPPGPGRGEIASDKGTVVSTRSFDVRKQRPLNEAVLLTAVVLALVYGRPDDVQRLVAGLRAHFSVEEKGHRDVGHLAEERELRIGPKQGG